MKYDINNEKQIIQLQKRAKFKYVEMYKGKESKQFKKTFKKPAFKRLLKKYSHPPLEVAQIAILGKRGLGVLATEDLHLNKGGKPRKLGIYWGELSLESPHHSHYVFVVSRFEIDANKYGNWTRFVNHSKGNFNVVAFQKTCKIGKIYLPYIEYALIKEVKAGEQLLVDYGPEYEFDKKHQIFLNPSNNSLRARDIFALHGENYMQMKGKQFALCKELVPHAVKLYAPIKSMQALSPELPILRADKRGHILDDNKQDGITALMLAAYAGNAKVVHALIKNNNANIEQQNIRNGFTALFYAIQSNSRPIMKDRIVTELVGAGIHLTTQDKQGLTALHWCVKNSNLRLIKLIFSDKKAKANAMEALDILDREGLSPITYAISRGEKEITSYLFDIFKKYYQKT